MFNTTWTRLTREFAMVSSYSASKTWLETFVGEQDICSISKNQSPSHLNRLRDLTNRYDIQKNLTICGKCLSKICMGVVYPFRHSLACNSNKNRQSILTWFETRIIWFRSRVHHFIIVLYTITSVTLAPLAHGVQNTLWKKKALLKITIVCSICCSLWYISSRGATRGTNTTIKVKSPHKQFATKVHTLFCFFYMT